MSDKPSSSQLPSRSIKVTISNREYSIKFPNNGQFIDIERNKIDLSNGNLKNMLFGTPSGQLAYILIEAVATFSILIPDLVKDLDVKSLLELDPYQSKQLVSAYEKHYYPWIEKWREVINAPVEQEDKEGDDEKDTVE